MNEKRCRELVLQRADGLCERCGRQGHTFHHRKNRSGGGGWNCANIVYLCGDGTRGCHGWVTVNPAEASKEGFHIKPWEDEREVPILLHRRLSRHLTWDTSDYDSTRADVEVSPSEVLKEAKSDVRTAETDHLWNPDW